MSIPHLQQQQNPNNNNREFRACRAWQIIEIDRDVNRDDTEPGVKPSNKNKIHSITGELHDNK
jgi:hypothetical protein